MSGHDPDEAADARSRASSRRRDDDDYNEYLWGEDSPRAFARRLKFGGRKTISKLEVQVDEDVDLSQAVPR